MNVADIQREVRRLPREQREKLTAWMVAEHPILSVDTLMMRAAKAATAGTFTPTPPTAENIPGGKTLAHALEVAGKLGVKK
ncbi:MAG TPA: hypothetical protein VGE76_24530 [Opitutaceae bacterium]